MSDSTRVLITGAGGSISVNIARSLRMSPEKPRLFGCDGNRYFIHLADADERKIVPPASKPSEYVSAIQALIREWKIDVVVPSNISEILVLSSHRDKFGARFLLPSHQAIEVGADKWKTYEVLKNAGLPVPRSKLIESEKDLDQALKEFGSPLWLRGRGIPGRGVGVASLPARTKAQAMGWVDFHEAWGNMTAAEYLSGDNLTWLGLWKDGNLIASQGRKRIAYVIPHVSPSGITGAPAVSCTIHDEELNELGKRAMLAIDPMYNGVGFVDFKCDSGGNARITEVNVGRFGTTLHFYTAAGANFPYWYVKLALGEKVKAKSTDVLPAGLYWIRSLDAGPALVKEAELSS